MTYVEMLRIKRVLVVYAIVLGVILVATVAAMLLGHGDITVSAHGKTAASLVARSSQVPLREAIADHFARHGTVIPLSVLLFLAGFLATIVATALAPSLSTERNHTPLAWTKPASRDRFALAYLAVDGAGIIAAFFIAIVFELLIVGAAGVGSFIRMDRDVPALLLMMAGIAFAYYGVIRAASVGFPGRGGAVAGTSWAVAYGLVGAANVPLPHVYHVAFVMLNFLNPLAYMTSFSDSSLWSSIVPLSVWARIAGVWLLALIAMTVAFTIYRKAEA